VHIGFRTVIMEGCQLERGCVIAPNSTVPAGSRIPENTMWGGDPVRYIKDVSTQETSALDSEKQAKVKVIEE
jgi:gamma-carbonic anhydrase